MHKSALELGNILSTMYKNAPRKEMVTMVHLFGILFHQDIRQAGVKEVVRASEIGDEYKAEVNKGVKLGAWVRLTPDMMAQLDRLMPALDILTLLPPDNGSFLVYQPDANRP